MQNTSLRRRIGAMLYDGILIFALMAMTTLPFIALRDGEHVDPTDNLLHQIALVAIIYSFFVGFWTLSGRTLGMQSWRLQLENLDGSRATFGGATIRFFAALLSWAAAGLGFLWQLWDKDKLAWHDRLSGTRLVHYPKEKTQEKTQEKT